jgi:hypothetical protein
MKRILVAACLLAIVTAMRSGAQEAARAAESGPPAKAQASPALAATDANGQPITTQIFADEASFDTEKRVGVFTKNVRVFDPRFNIQSDKLTVFIHKEEGEGLEKAIAEGHVGVVRDKPDPKGGPPSKAVGLSERRFILRPMETWCSPGVRGCSKVSIPISRRARTRSWC